MRRIHAIELEDQPWMPRIIRDFATDYLRFVIEVPDAYGPAIPLLTGALKASGAERVIDLCSGGGGPWPGLIARVREGAGPLQVVLTDRYPNVAAAERAKAAEGLSYLDEPVDALRVPAYLTGFRTMFTALHHFRPAEVRAILTDAARAGQPMAAFEFSERSVRGLLMMVFAPLMVLLVTPFIRPFRWSRLLFTYLIPIVPLVVIFDGVVSCLRSYTPDELDALTGDAAEPGYSWKTGSVRGRAPIPVTYVIGSRMRA